MRENARDHVMRSSTKILKNRFKEMERRVLYGDLVLGELVNLSLYENERRDGFLKWLYVSFAPHMAGFVSR